MNDIDSGLESYCVSKSSEVSSCNWISIDKTLSTSITYNAVEDGIYYVYAKDSVGLISEVAINSITLADLCSYEVGKTWIYDYTGSEQLFTSPCKATYKLEVWGAQGGNITCANGGEGGYASGSIKLNSSSNLYVFVGGQNGYNGGGSAGTDSPAENGANGGGATDIRTLGGSWNNTDGLLSRIIVAGGGSGASGNGNGHYNGSTGNTGAVGNAMFTNSDTSGWRGGSGLGKAADGRSGNQGDQTSIPTAASQGGPGGDGSFGIGGSGGKWGGTKYPTNISYLNAYAGGSGSGGGGGFYGGGGGGAGGGWWGGNGGVGGGGSGYVYTSATVSQYPSGCKLNSNYYLSDTEIKAGGRTGNGYAKITLISF